MLMTMMVTYSFVDIKGDTKQRGGLRERISLICCKKCGLQKVEVAFIKELKQCQN